MNSDLAAPDSIEVMFRPYRPEDLKQCARLTQEAFPPGRKMYSRNQGEVTMEGYVESSRLWSTWSEVACVGDSVAGFLFGRVQSTWKERSRLGNLLMEMRMLLRWFLSDPTVLIRSFGLMWTVWMTETKVTGKTPRSDAEIELLVVDSRHRGKGIGRELVDRFLAVAKSGGAEIVTVYTEDLQSNYLFYEKYGFKRVATFHDDVTSYFAGQDSTAIVFALDLRKSQATDADEASSDSGD